MRTDANIAWLLADTLCSGLPFPPPTFPGIESFTVEARALWPVLCECRVIKTGE